MKKQYEVVLTREEQIQVAQDFRKDWYRELFVGMSKRELVAFCEKCGFTYTYKETGHGIPSALFIHTGGFSATRIMYFDKHTRRVYKVI